MMAAVHPESLGAYVITMAGKPSDVLAVELLQREAGITPPRRVVPLFETARDLRARRGHDRHAAGDPVVSRPRDEARGPAGGDGRLLGFRQGRRPAGRGLGALQGAGVHRRDQSCARGSGHALPRPGRQRRPRRRTDPPRDSLAAARLDRRHAARHRAGRDDPGEVRAARHRLAHARGLHDGDARSHPRRAGAAGARWRARDGPLCRRTRATRSAGRCTTTHASSSTSASRPPRPSSTRCTSEPAGRRQPRAPGRPAGAARDPVAVRLDADTPDAAVVARHRGSHRRARIATSAARCTGTFRSSDRPSS